MTDDGSQSLNAPITLVALKAAVVDMHRGKSPGLAGIPPEFYTASWHSLGPLFLDMIRVPKERLLFQRYEYSYHFTVTKKKKRSF